MTACETRVSKINLRQYITLYNYTQCQTDIIDDVYTTESSCKLLWYERRHVGAREQKDSQTCSLRVAPWSYTARRKAKGERPWTPLHSISAWQVYKVNRSRLQLLMQRNVYCIARLFICSFPLNESSDDVVSDSSCNTVARA
jgi:hypothetical protein